MALGASLICLKLGGAAGFDPPTHPPSARLLACDGAGPACACLQSRTDLPAVKRGEMLVALIHAAMSSARLAAPLMTGGGMAALVTARDILLEAAASAAGLTSTGAATVQDNEGAEWISEVRAESWLEPTGAANAPAAAGGTPAHLPACCPPTPSHTLRHTRTATTPLHADLYHKDAGRAEACNR